MKNIFLIIVSLFCVSNAYSQLSYQVVKNDFDDQYRIAYTSENNDAVLKLENVEGSMSQVVIIVMKTLPLIWFLSLKE
jgi:hypothetical protein